MTCDCLTVTSPHQTRDNKRRIVVFSKYESDDVTQSAAMDKLLRLAGRSPEVLQELLTEAGLTVSKAALSKVTTCDAADDLDPNL